MEVDREERVHPDAKTWVVRHPNFMGGYITMEGLWSERVMRMFAWRYCLQEWPEAFEDSVPSDFELTLVEAG